MSNFSITTVLISPNNFLSMYPEKISPFLVVFIHLSLIGDFIRFVHDLVSNRVSFFVTLCCCNTKFFVQASNHWKTSSFYHWIPILYFSRPSKWTFHLHIRQRPIGPLPVCHSSIASNLYRFALATLFQKLLVMLGEDVFYTWKNKSQLFSISE